MREGSMKHAATLALTFVAGIALGALAIPALRAQPAQPAAFVVAEMHVTDPAGFTEYIRREPATLAPFHGRVVARALPDIREGAPADGIASIYAFNSPEDANHWYNSADYAKLLPARQNAAKSRVYFLSGVVR
jgi:uncharacterized protein (DUF1330 family)